VPNTELAELLGCRLDGGAVEVDERQQTSVQDIYCAGEPTGIGGLELSMAEGAIAAMAASGSDDFGAFRRRRKRLRKIAEAMNHCYRPREELRSLCPPETVVCRCEDATFGEMSAFRSFRAAKLQTRCGMGACQGRVCGAASRFLFGWGRDTVRPPIFPVTAGALAGIDEDYE
jgi:NADPH-dependent 2,4-dienoyl-CoA reductase/sulfur reductase-like enzyme